MFSYIIKCDDFWKKLIHIGMIKKFVIEKFTEEFNIHSKSLPHL